MESENTVNTDKITHLCADLIRNQSIIAKCDAEKWMRETAQQIADCVNDAKTELSEQAKLFGAKIDKITTEYEQEKIGVKAILAKYEEKLKDVAKPFDDEIKEVMATKSELQQEFIALVANFIPQLVQARNENTQIKSENKAIMKEAVKAMEAGEKEIAIEQIEKLVAHQENNHPESVKTAAMRNLGQMKAKLQLIKLCDEEIKAINLRRKADIQKVQADKKMELSKVQKQSFVHKIIGSLFSKINGTKRFIKMALQPLVNKMVEINKTHIPNIKASIKENMASFSEQFDQQNKKFEKAIDEKVDSFAEKYAQAKEFVISGYKDLQEKAKKGFVTARDFVEWNALVAEDGAKNMVNFAKDAIKDKAETAALHGLLFADKVKDNAETAALHGLEFADKVNELWEKAKSSYSDRKKAIIEGAKAFQQSAMGAWENTKAGVADLPNKAQKTYKGIIGKTLEVKMNLVREMQKKLDEQSKEIAEKMAQLNGENRIVSNAEPELI